MLQHAFPVGTDDSNIGEIIAAPQTVTVLSASLIPLPGFRVPRLVSTGVIAGNTCLPATLVLLPPVHGKPSVVLLSGSPYQPLALRGFTMQLGTACGPQLIYVVRATAAGQYAVGGLRVLVSHDGRTETMFDYFGVDLWYYGARSLPSASQVKDGQRAAFAAQVAISRSDAP